VQRFGKECVGGAEAHAWQLTTWLRNNTDWQIEVLTSCAKDYRHWKNEYPSGLQKEDGIAIQRFPVRFPRWSGIFALTSRLVFAWTRRFQNRHGALGAVTLFLQRIWLMLQGPYTPELVKYIQDQKYQTDFFLFFTYLYYPTVVGLPHVKDKACLIPTAHDEPPFYFDLVAKMLEGSFKIITNTPVEKSLMQRVHGLDEGRFLEGAFGLPDLTPSKALTNPYPNPYIKSEKGRQPITLVLAGKMEDDFSLPTSPHILYLGFVKDEQKTDLIRYAGAIVNPSRLESLSMIVLEGLTMGKPILVTYHCDVLRSYAETLPTVQAYRDYDEFESLLQELSSQNFVPQLDHANTGRDWVLDHFSWEKVRDNILQSMPK
jgi:glycosyltransferase involved in cell wall biosynthesis